VRNAGFCRNEVAHVSGFDLFFDQSIVATKVDSIVAFFWIPIANQPRCYFAREFTRASHINADVVLRGLKSGGYAHVSKVMAQRSLH